MSIYEDTEKEYSLKLVSPSTTSQSAALRAGLGDSAELQEVDSVDAVFRQHMRLVVRGDFPSTRIHQMLALASLHGVAVTRTWIG